MLYAFRVGFKTMPFLIKEAAFVWCFANAVVVTVKVKLRNKR